MSDVQDGLDKPLFFWGCFWVVISVVSREMLREGDDGGGVASGISLCVLSSYFPLGSFNGPCLPTKPEDKAPADLGAEPVDF